MCTSKYIREYFRNGTLPEVGTVCEVESTTFGDNSKLNIAAFNDGDQKLFQASRGLYEDYDKHFGRLL